MNPIFPMLWGDLVIQYIVYHVSATEGACYA